MLCVLFYLFICLSSPVVHWSKNEPSDSWMLVIQWLVVAAMYGQLMTTVAVRGILILANVRQVQSRCVRACCENAFTLVAQQWSLRLHGPMVTMQWHSNGLCYGYQGVLIRRSQKNPVTVRSEQVDMKYSKSDSKSPMKTFFRRIATSPKETFRPPKRLSRRRFSWKLHKVIQTLPRRSFTSPHDGISRIKPKVETCGSTSLYVDQWSPNKKDKPTYNYKLFFGPAWDIMRQVWISDAKRIMTNCTIAIHKTGRASILCNA